MCAILGVPLRVCPTPCVSHSVCVRLRVCPTPGVPLRVSHSVCPLRACLTPCVSHSGYLTLCVSLRVSYSVSPCLCVSFRVCSTPCFFHSVRIPFRVWTDWSSLAGAKYTEGEQMHPSLLHLNRAPVFLIPRETIVPWQVQVDSFRPMHPRIVMILQSSCLEKVKCCVAAGRDVRPET